MHHLVVLNTESNVHSDVNRVYAQGVYGCVFVYIYENSHSFQYSATFGQYCISNVENEEAFSNLLVRLARQIKTRSRKNW